MLSRWFDVDPVAEMTSLRGAMDRLVEQAVVRPGTFLSVGQGSATPPINLFEHDKQYVVQVYLPGIQLTDVDLSVRQSTLLLKGRWPEPRIESQQKVMWLAREMPTGEFARQLTLPKEVDVDRVEARYDQGILTIVLPLAAHEQPRSIAIRNAGAHDVPGTVERKQPELAATGER